MTALARSPLLTAQRSRLSEKIYDELRALYREVGIPDRIAAWEQEDRELENAARDAAGKPPIRGGRPAVLNTVDVLIVAHCLLLAGEDALFTTIADAIRHRLPMPVRRTMQLPDVEPTSNCDRYKQVCMRMKHIDKIINPNPGVAGRRLTPEEYFRRIEALDEHDRIRRHKRGIKLSNLIIEASLRVIPDEYRDLWDGTVCIDATAIRIHGKRGNPAGFSQGTPETNRTTSAEPDAGWYGRNGDHSESANRVSKDSKFANDVHLAVMTQQTTTNGTTRQEFPYLAASIAMHAPGMKIGEIGLTLLQSLRQREHDAGEVITDRAYFPNAHPEKLQRPARKLGYVPVFDYPVHHLGLQASINGAILVDGNFYCPSLPKHLITATRDFREGRISEEQRDLAIAERTPYLMTVKEGPDEQGRFRLICPAIQPSQTLNCDLRDNALSGVPDRGGRTPIPMNLTNGQSKGIICEQKSVTFDFSDDDVAKYWQKYQYRSTEWKRHYQGPRSIVESFNATVKDEHYGRLDEPGLRRARGYGKQLVLVALMVSSSNIGKIRSFLRRVDEQARTPDPGTTQRRKRSHDVQVNVDDNVIDADPGWLPGHKRPAA